MVYGGVTVAGRLKRHRERPKVVGLMEDMTADVETSFRFFSLIPTVDHKLLPPVVYWLYILLYRYCTVLRERERDYSLFKR